MINNLGNSDLAVQLKETFSRRMNQRRTKVYSLLQYLHKGNQTYVELELDPLLNFEHLSKATIVSMVTGLSKPHDHNEPFELESDNETAEVEIDLQVFMQENLTRAINMERNSKIWFKSRTTKDVMGIVKKEVAIFEFEGKREANLKSCYENLNSIPPSSVEPGHVFSGCGRTVTKIRSSLHDDSVDMLNFLRGYFKTENNWLLIEKDCKF
jgi:hypothetical protein